MVNKLSFKQPIKILALLTLFSFQTSAAQPSINEMQTCQGLLNFVSLKLENLPSTYEEDDLAIIEKGLSAYDKYIQNVFVSPGLLKFSGGNKSKASTLQKQVDTYKNSIVKSYQNQYPYNKLSMDFAQFINKCTKKAMPKGNDLAILKASLFKMVELANKQ